MFANVGELSADTKELFKKYQVRGFIIYDPSSTAAGSRPHPGIWNVTVDRTLPVENRVSQFGMQVASRLFHELFLLLENLALS
ncbi:hypothetical protein C8Q80DRAFT_1266792 [Daedaleopsis nitida]|nr:hypothetical protein C8Q80DRAFT_1266792 [Daedaleopsis nitida]